MRGRYGCHSESVKAAIPMRETWIAGEDQDKPSKEELA